MRLNAVYYAHGVGCAVNPVVIRPTFVEDKALWEDTSDRSKSFVLEKIFGLPSPDSGGERLDWQQCPSMIRFRVQTDKKKAIIELTLMTLEVYNEKVRQQVAGSPVFHSDRDVQSYYLNTNFNRML